jgi:hypothetical protein
LASEELATLAPGQNLTRESWPRAPAPCVSEGIADGAGVASAMKPTAARLALLCGCCCLAAAGSLPAQSPSVSAVPPSADALAMPLVRVNSAAPYNDLILEQIRTMPQAGGYSAGHDATQRLGSAVELGPRAFEIEADRAQPSYCSGATYLVFLKTVNALALRGVLPADERVLSPLLITGQRDGQGVWGRWNANGPGTARLFYELSLGPNFSDFAAAQAGDFMKIFWSDAVGRREHGHSVIYLGTTRVDGVENVRFWSSNLHVGYSEKSVPRSRIKAAIFSRLTNPANLARAGALGARPDPYLASLLSTDSNLAEVRRECGLPPE